MSKSQRVNIVNKLRGIRKPCLVIALVAVGTSCGLARAIAAEPASSHVEEGVQVLTRGPVHEAFAETISFDPKAGTMVPKAPPAEIQELPPDQKPKGANIAWIAGYWGWDDDRNDFLWISGIWRDLPPGRQWVSGYWGESKKGYQWTAGYWADAKASEVEYLPEPPKSEEAAPKTDAPSADQTWVPGSWIWQQASYVWRPGNWLAMKPDWIWVPAYYVWTPRGYVFVDGYWDYSIERRGVLFAPVYFNPSVYSRAGFSYSPSVVINLDVLSDHLFLRPARNHYYFGDYYAANYDDAGFYSGFSFHNHNGYDPIYAHDRWQHRQDRDWEQRQEVTFQHLRDHEDSRPPRTWLPQSEPATISGKSIDTSFALAAPLAQLAQSKDGARKFQPLDKNERLKISQRGQEAQSFRAERRARETNAASTSAATTSNVSEPVRIKILTSPIVAKRADELGSDQAPPKSHASLMPDLQIQAKAGTPANERNSSQQDSVDENHFGVNPPEVKQVETKISETKEADVTPMPTEAPAFIDGTQSSEQSRPYTPSRLQPDAEQSPPASAPRSDLPQPRLQEDPPQPKTDARPSDDASHGVLRPGGAIILSGDTSPSGRSGDPQVEKRQPQPAIDRPAHREQPAPQTQHQQPASQPRASAPVAKQGKVGR